jgi:hypothetical protein
MKRSLALIAGLALLVLGCLSAAQAQQPAAPAVAPQNPVATGPTTPVAIPHLPAVQAGAPAASQPNEIIIDVDLPLPSNIDARPGTTITLVRKILFVGSNVDYRQVVLDSSKDPVINRIYNIRAPDAPVGYRVLVQYLVERHGIGGVVISHTVVAANAVPQTVTVRVDVK